MDYYTGNTPYWHDELSYQDRQAFKYNYRGSRKNPFEVGDIVRLKNGTTPIEVIWVGENLIKGKYVSSGIEVSAREWNKFVMLKDYKSSVKNGEDEMTVKLYEVKDGDTTIFATKLAVNSAGKWVMEEKGTGKVITADKESVEEVMPHTISVVFNKGGQVYSYFAEAGSYIVGDFYIDKGFKVVQVVKVDTKSKSATKDFVPVAKLETVAVESQN